MKTIMIDGRNLGLEKGTGVATYARNLSYELHSLGYKVDVLYGNRASPGLSKLLQEISFFDNNAGDRSRLVELIEKFHKGLVGPFGQYASEIPISGQIIYRTFSARLPYFDRLLNSTNLFNRSQNTFQMWRLLSRVSMDRKPDLAHWTYPLPLRIPGRPNIYTFHDLVPLRLPYTTLDNKKKYLRLLKKIYKHADHIVTVSECSKADLINILGFEESRITNTYQSVEIPKKFLDKTDDMVAREVEGAVGVDYKGYYLFWGSIEPKKNIGRMIEAYLASKVDAPLVIVGAQAWKSEEELRLLNDENIVFMRTVDNDIFTRKRVIQLSYAPFSLLVSLIRGAKATLFPSLYEGFGLPALESMMLGTPVICGNTSSLPEVVGRSAMSVDPYDTAAISAAIREIDADEGLRSELAARGKLQAERFSPQHYRDRLQSVYQRYL